MTLRRTAFVLIAALLFAGGIFAQKDRGKEIKGRELEWSDFAGEVDPSSQWFAYTDWVTFYRYSTPDVRGDRVYVKVTIQLYLRPNSWVRPDKKDDRLLEHERGHYNIGRLCAKQMERTMSSTAYSLSNYAKEIDQLYWQISAQCKQVNDQYDTDTRHFNDREQQALWNQKIAEMLKK